MLLSLLSFLLLLVMCLVDFFRWDVLLFSGCLFYFIVDNVITSVSTPGVPLCVAVFYPLLQI